MRENCLPHYFIKHFFHASYDRASLTEKHAKVIIHAEVYYIRTRSVDRTRARSSNDREELLRYSSFSRSSLYPRAMKLTCQMLSEEKSTVPCKKS